MRKARRFGGRNLSGLGFDYGVGIRAAAVGSMEFHKNLMDAEIVAVAYGHDYSQALKSRLPAITLVGRNEEPLRGAFEEFSNWAEWTDADAIEVTMVFMKDGGYRLCINPEVDALYKRALKYDTVFNPLALQVIWIKVINSTSQPLIDLRKFLSGGIIRPFLLRGAHYTGILQENRPPTPELLEPIAHNEELLKFEIKFVDEGSKKDLHWQRIALGSRRVERATVVEDRTIPKSMVWTRRKEAIKRLFPVTLWRSNSCESSVVLKHGAEERGLHGWQIEQAICNLVLSREIADGNFHFQGCKRRDWPEQLWSALTSRFEVSGVDKEGFEQLTVEAIVRQAILDAKILLKEYGEKRVPNKVERVQYLLRKHSLHCKPEK